MTLCGWGGAFLKTFFHFKNFSITRRRQKGPKNLCNVSLPKIPFFSTIFVAFITIFGMCIKSQGEFFMHSPKQFLNGQIY